MGLRVESATFRNFRNFEERTVEFGPAMTVLVGHNAVGKTNTIEGLQLLTSGKSFRGRSTFPLVHAGCTEGSASIVETGDGRVVDVELQIKDEHRRYYRNGKAIHLGQVAGELVSVLFTPDDLSFVKGSASYRRDEIDSFGSQMNKAYDKLVTQYKKAVSQRNHLLRAEWADDAMLAAWDEAVALGGAQLIVRRCALFDRIRTKYIEIYKHIAPDEEPDVYYTSTIGCAHETTDISVVHDRFLDDLAKNREAERDRGITMVGPHYDDLIFLVNGNWLRDFGSQGQQRTAVLAWKMAEVEVVEQIRQEKPLLLLDDVMSELDERRRAALTSYASRGVQMVVSTTNLGYFSDEMLEGAKIVQYEG